MVFSIVTSVVTAGNPVSGSDQKNTDKKLVSGKVIDKISGEEIAGAKITIGTQEVYTDLEGNFSTWIGFTKTQATINFISYTESTIVLDPLSYDRIVIGISGK
jgi:hypothetical protein